MRYFKEIIIADALTNNGDYLRANNYLINAHKRNPYSRLVKKIKPRILFNLKKQVNSYLDKNDYLSAIELFEKNRESWLSNVKDNDFKKALARSFEMAGMKDYALAYYIDYVNEKKNKGQKIETPVILSMATLYQKNKDYENMDKYLEDLSVLSDLSEKDKFKAINLKFEVFDEKAAYKRAEKLLLAYMKSIKNNEKIKIKTSLMLSDFYDERAKHKESLKILKNLEDVVGEAHNEYYQLSKRLVYQLVKNSDELSAVKKINDIKEKVEFKNDEPFIFYAGDLLIKNNFIEDGKKVWDLVKGKNSIYGKMIVEKLSHKKWVKDYGKYIDRIPAMDEVKKGEY